MIKTDRETFEVTEEMIRAGVDALALSNDEAYSHVPYSLIAAHVKSVYLAMETAAHECATIGR